MIAKSLLVNGSARFLNTLYANDMTVSGTTTFAGINASSLAVSGNATINGATTLKGTKLTGTLTIVNTASSNADTIGLVIGGDGTGNRMRAMCDGLQAVNSDGVKQLYLNYWGGVVSLGSGNQITANNGTFTTPTLNATKSTINNLYVPNELRAVNYNIETVSHLGGAFFVAPSIEVPAGNNVSITAISGNTITATINDNSITTTAFSPTWWCANSLVKIAGSIAGIPIGTCNGTLTSNLIAGRVVVQFTYTGQSEKPLSVANSQASSGLSVTLTTIGGTKPIGIYMTALGQNSWADSTALNKTAISIYGGTTDGAIPDSTNPVVRIGNLAGLPKVNNEQPVGWGIYTNHGYFSGLIVSNSGKIGNFTISDALYSTAKAFGTTANNVYIGDDGISLGTAFKVTKAGELTATSGSIASWYISSNSLATGTWGTDSSAMLCTGTSGSRSIGGSSSINGWVFTAGSKFGVTNTGDLYCSALHANSGSIASSVTIGGKDQSEYLNDNIQVGGRNLLLGTGGSDYRAVRTADMANSVQNNLTISMSSGEIIMTPSLATTGEKYFRFLSPVSNSLHGLTAGDTYTLSFYVKGVESYTGALKVRSQWQTGSSWTGGISPVVTLTSDYKYYSISDTLPQNATAYYLSFQIFDSTTDTIAYIKNLKLELGNKATDWSPAPEDVDTSISNAAKTATNYLTTITGTTGISVHDSGDTSNFVNMNSNGVFVYKGGTQRAQFADTTIIGKPYVSGATDNESRIEMDYHSFKLTDREGSDYVYLSDLRNASGVASIKERLNTVPNTNIYNLSFEAINTNYTIVLKDANNSDITSDYTISDKTSTDFKVSEGLPSGSYALVTYNTSSRLAKAFTFGSRMTSSAVGGFSFCEGRELVASGTYSHAEGYWSMAEAIYSHAEGFGSDAIGSASHAEGTSTDAVGNSSHAEGYNTKAAGDYSHAGGLFTIANIDSQCVIGKYNDPSFESALNAQGWWTTQETRTYTQDISGYDSTKARARVKNDSEFKILSQSVQNNVITIELKCIVENPSPDEERTFYTDPRLVIEYFSGPLVIGNGTANDSRSNALIVDWNGGLEMYLDIDSSANASTAATSGTDKDLFNAIRNLNWYNDVIT